MSSTKYKKVKLHTIVKQNLKGNLTYKKMLKAKEESKLYNRLDKGAYIAAKKPTKAEVKKYKSSAKNYDDAYLRAFYRKNRAVIDYNLSKNELIEVYGGNTYKLFKELVLDKMFNMNKKGTGYNFKSKKTDPWEKKELNTREAIAKVFNSKDMYGERQVQKENFKKILKDEGFDLREIRDPKTGKIVSINEMEFIEKESDIDPTGKKTVKYTYKVGNYKFIFHQSPKGGMMIEKVKL